MLFTEWNLLTICICSNVFLFISSPLYSSTAAQNETATAAWGLNNQNNNNMGKHKRKNAQQLIPLELNRMHEFGQMFVF